MKYSLGDSLADYGFSFFEKLHSPIFLLHKSGTIKKINEAGRKLLSVAHITRRELEHFATTLVATAPRTRQVEYQTYPTRQKQIRVVSKQLDSSDYLLVELIR
jgi:nitrogen-specific signal transduction histidine kinase